MELLYLYIPQYKSISNQEFNFSNRYRFSRNVSEAGKRLSFELVEKNDSEDSWRLDFFGKGVSNLSAIVGANGTGKSTVLQFINEELSKGGNSKRYNFFSVFEHGGELYIKKREDDISIEEKFAFKDSIDGTNMIQFYPLSDLTFSNEYLFNQVGGGRVNVSDNALFADDFERENRANRNEIFKTEFLPAISPYVISNMERELEFFLLDYFNEIEPAHVLSVEFLDIKTHLINEIKSYEATISKWKSNESLRKSFERTLTNLNYLLELYKGGDQLIYSDQYKITRAFSFMLFMDIQFSLDQALGQLEDPRIEKIHDDMSKIMAEILYALQETQKGRPLELDDYHGALKRIAATNEINLNIAVNANNIYEFLTKHLYWAVTTKPNDPTSVKLFELYQMDSKKVTGTVNLFFREFPDETKTFLKQLKSITFISRFLNYEWKGSLNQTYHYSTGESQMIKLFSRLNYGFNILGNKINDGVLIMLDEAELSMHPEWQRKFVRWLLNFTNSRAGQGKVQFILTTHSPLMLSDIPSENVIRLGKDSISRDTNSFGANLFELMKDNFFLKNGFIGEFAQEKINSLIDFIESETPEDNEAWTVESARSFVNIIGEPLIREELRKLLLERFRKNLSEEDLDEEIEWIKKLKRR